MTTNTLSTLPKLNIGKISDKARIFFEQANAHPIGSDEYKAARKKANQILAQECAKYITENNLSAENIVSLSSSELVFLYQHLQYSEIKNKDRINTFIHDEMFDRLLDAQDKMDDKKIITAKDKKALVIYFKTYLSRLKKQPLAQLSEIEADNLKYYPSYITQLKKYKNIESSSSGKETTREIVHPNIRAMSRLGDELFDKAAKCSKNHDQYRKFRKAGNLKIKMAARDYINDNINDDAELAQLKTAEIVFLHKNLRLGKEDAAIADKLEAICQSRLKAAETKIDNYISLPEDELFAFAEYCSYRQRDWENSKNKNVLLDWYWIKNCGKKVKKALKNSHNNSGNSKQAKKQSGRD